MSRSPFRSLLVVGALGGLLLLGACGRKSEEEAQSGSSSAAASTATSSPGSEAGSACNAGTPKDQNDPCVIVTVEQLQAVRDDVRGHYALGADIDATATRDWNDGAGFAPIANFRGTFDGAGYVIEGLFIEVDKRREWVGLFAYTNEGSELRNVGLRDATVITHGDDNSVGALVGNLAGSARNVWADAEVDLGDGGSVGVLAGSLAGSGELTDAYSFGKAHGDNGSVGGLVGSNHGTVSRTFSAAVVESRIGDSGGIAGSGSAELSYWDEEVSGVSSAAGGEPRTTEEMRQKGTFAGWDFDEVWAIENDHDYPDLRSASRY